MIYIMVDVRRYCLIQALLLIEPAQLIQPNPPWHGYLLRNRAKGLMDRTTCSFEDLQEYQRQGLLLISTTPDGETYLELTPEARVGNRLDFATFRENIARVRYEGDNVSK